MEPHPHSIEELEKAVKKPLTELERRKLMSVYFTIRRDIVVICGHKLDLKSLPKTNCVNCWMAWLNANGSFTQTAEKCFQEEGRDVLEKLQGKKFVKYLLTFLAALARLQQEQEMQQNYLKENNKNDA